MEIVSFTSQDQEATADFMKSIYREMGWQEQPKEGLNDLAIFFHLPNDGVLLLVKDEQKIVGTGGCIKLDEEAILLKRFYIAQDLRGSGIAKKLLDSLVDGAKKLHGKRIVIDVSKKNPRAIRFYEKNGFMQYDQKPLESWPETKKPDIFNYYFLPL